MLSQMNIKCQPVIQQGNLTIDPQCCTVLLESENIDLFPKEFDVLLLLAQFPGLRIYEVESSRVEILCPVLLFLHSCVDMKSKLKKFWRINIMT